MKYCKLQCEDEWADIEQRFEKEGIDYSRLKTEEKLIYVWRWLVDADINLQNARKMIEKLRLKQNEELEVSFIIFYKRYLKLYLFLLPILIRIWKITWFIFEYLLINVLMIWKKQCPFWPSKWQDLNAS